MSTESHGNSTDSVSEWIERLGAGDDDAARELWERYFGRLMQVARRRLGGGPSGVSDAEDVAASVFESVFIGIREGRFEKASDRDDLWRLLVKLTRWKAVDEIRRRNAAKRGGGEVEGMPPHVDPADPGATPDEVVELEERLRQCLGDLENPVVRRVAELRLAGWANREIADQLGILTSAVELKLKIIRRRWEALASADDSERSAG